MLLRLDGLMNTALRAPADGGSGAASAAPAAGELSVDQAVGLIGDARRAEREPNEDSPSSATPDAGADDEEELVIDEVTDAAASDKEPSGEDEGEADAEEELPPIAPPKSWSKEDQADFKTLPRATQQRIAERERVRDAAVNKRLNDAAESQRATGAEVEAAKRARAQYEAALPKLLERFQSEFEREFADIKSWDDVHKMQREDPDRYGRWDLANKQGEAIAQENEKAQKRQAQETEARFAGYIGEQQQLFFAKAPEFANPETADKNQKAVVKMFNDIGIETDEIRAMALQGRPISFHDHRFQLMARKAMLYDKAVAASKKPKPKPVPTVQRPGAAAPKGAAESARVKEIDRKFDAEPSIDNLVAVLGAGKKR